MAITLSDTYYLKALDYYPYNLEELIENLNYALSYDDQHSDANCLMGRLQHRQLNNYEEAEYYFQTALASEPKNIEVYKHYSFLLLDLREYKKARKLALFSYTIKGVDHAEIKRIEGLIYEGEKDFLNANRLYKKAIEECLNNEFIAKTGTATVLFFFFRSSMLFCN